LAADARVGQAGPVIDDGEYPAFVLDAEPGVGDGGEPLLHLSVTILSGAHRGAVLEVTAARMARTAIDVIGMPATLVVLDGEPSLTIDD